MQTLNQSIRVVVFQAITIKKKYQNNISRKQLQSGTANFYLQLESNQAGRGEGRPPDIFVFFHIHKLQIFLREAAKKSSSLNGRAIMEKKLFKKPFFQRSKIFQKLGGGVGWLGLNGPAIKRRTFFCSFHFTL